MVNARRLGCVKKVNGFGKRGGGGRGVNKETGEGVLMGSGRKGRKGHKRD